MPIIKLKRIYERIEVTDGLRILVDRLWPRGVRHSTSNVDVWLKKVAPSDELRKYFVRYPKKWVIYKKRYRKELMKNPAAEKLLQIASTEGVISLIYSTKNDERNSAIILKDYIDTGLKHLKKKEDAVAKRALEWKR